MDNFFTKVFRPKNYTEPPKQTETKEFAWVDVPAVIVEANVNEYRDAFVAAHSQYNQQRTYIYDIYQNALDFDAHLIGLIERRLLNTSGRAFEYIVNNEPSKVSVELIDNPMFTRLIEDLLMVKFWGMGLFEFTNSGGLGYQSIPVKHIDPFKKMVRREQGSPSVDDKSWEKLWNVAFVGDARDFGILQQLSLLAMYKRAAMGDWAQYSQLAGTNFRIIKYRGQSPDPKRRSAIREQVYNAGSGVLDLPSDVDVQTSNQSSSSQNQLFENYIKYLDDAMTKLILGQTMTTEDGSSRSQAEVHERTQDDIFDADGKYILDLLNYDLYDIFVKAYGLEKGGKWRFVENVTQKQIEEIDRDLKLKQLGVMFTEAELREKYGLTPALTTPSPQL